jgi:hypothetical protein
MLPPNVLSALSTAPPEMFHTSLPSFPKDAPRDPRDTDNDVAHHLPRHETSSRLTSTDGQKDLAHPVKRPGYRVTAGACETADLDNIPLTCL